ncbi:hypothetical protein CASFOL_025846 [Castilleja foliolosa]|uniref:(S)-2-hydroxy-acid oxidase n=1 Tax=Castilleja foliolosa TaxID=1961234 RepID=A0ABD3CT99_9LAMI
MASERIISEFEERTRLALPKMYYDFYAGGAEDQHTLEQNVKAFRNINIVPRVLMGISRVDTSTTIMGCSTSGPLMVAPTAMHKLAHHEGEIATARASASSNVIMVYKRMIAPQLKNFEGLVSTEVVTDKGSGIEALASKMLDDSLCWKDIGWLKSITNLPILVKGILTHEDALRALEVGVDGIIVSNHGARQLDYTPATITVLEEVVLAVQGKIPVILDGGVRRGSDIFKALALGAQAVMIGRPIIYGLAAKGENGVRQVIDVLKDELEQTMALSGCCTLKDISRLHVRTDQDRLCCKYSRL